MLTQWNRRQMCQALGSAGWLLTSGLVGCASKGGTAESPDGLVWQTLGESGWFLPGAAGEDDALNRGRTSGLWALLEPEAASWWLLGTGPSPVMGQAVARSLWQQTGSVVRALVNTWARPQAVLGNRAWPEAALWAHEEVAAEMQQRCAHCEARLAMRLGVAAEDLGSGPAAEVAQRVPHWPRQGGGLLTGERGSLGPWQWWRLHRDAEHRVTVWRAQHAAVWAAPGLLWGDGPPDLRDARLEAMHDSLQRLLGWAASDGAAARWLPEQGGVLDAHAPAQALAYLAGLRASVLHRQAQGGLETDPPAHWPGLNGAWAVHERHALNWQRAWRELE